MCSHAFGFSESLDTHIASAVLLGLLSSAISSAKYESSLLPFYNEYDQSSIQHFLPSETRVLFEANLVVCAERTSFLPIFIILYSELRCSTSFLQSTVYQKMHCRISYLPIVIILYSELRCSTSFLPMTSLLIHAVR
jgi:hypothetical protein